MIVELGNKLEMDRVDGGGQEDAACRLRASWDGECIRN
jgi:hypothetical protein